MIVNLPNKSDFENIAKENLLQAFNLLFQIYEKNIDHEDEVIKEEVPISDIWDHYHGTLKTALILLYTAIENLMKAVVCETSPLLLIDKDRKEWPSLPGKADKEFDTLYTIGGESLLTTFCAVNSSLLRDEALINFIEDTRQKRNIAIHGTNVTGLTPKYIIENILKTFSIWFGSGSWHVELKENIKSNPLFGYFDWDYESAISYKFLDFSLLLLGDNALSKYLPVNITGRPYFCPSCKRNIDKEFGDLTSKWAFLDPNTPESKNVYCLNCYESFEVTRKKCIVNKCKGNVIHEDEDGENICLTCFKTNETNN